MDMTNSQMAGFIDGHIPHGQVPAWCWLMELKNRKRFKGLGVTGRGSPHGKGNAGKTRKSQDCS